MGKKSKATNRRSGTNSKNDNGDNDPISFDPHHHDKSESNGDNDSGIGWGNRSLFSMNNGSDTINDNFDDDNFNDDDNDNDDDRIIQRGDPGDENTMIITSNRIQIIQDSIQVLCDIIHEKRTTQREMILRKCYKVLALYGTSCGTMGYNIVASHCSEIIESCLFGLRPRQSSTEQYATCRCIEVISIVLCNNEDCMDQWITSLHESLRRTIISSSRSTVVRMAALRALSITVFLATITIGVTNNHTTDDDGMAIESLLDLCEAIATNHEYRNHTVPTALRATAIDCWSLLASTLDDWTISGQDDVFIGRGTAILVSLKNALDDTKLESAELRSSSAQCLSLIHEARVNLGVIDTTYENGTHSNDTDYNENVENDGKQTKDKLVAMNNATARRYQKGSWDGSRYEVLMDEVKQRISELANESSHRISKKDKKEQRSNFREYLSTIVDDESPELVINFRNSTNVTLSSWKTIIPLNFIRQSLQSGYQTQLLSNPVLQHYFNIQHSIYDNSSYNNTMSQIEKRLLLSKSGETYKVADQDRRKKRDKRENIKNHFLTADGDDI
jgi:hypothetical protein